MYGPGPAGRQPPDQGRHTSSSSTIENSRVIRRERGYAGGYNTLARYLRPLRRVDAAALAALPQRPAPPTVQVNGWITGLPRHLDPADAVHDRSMTS